MTRAKSAFRGMLFQINENETELAIQQFLSEPMEWTKYLGRAVVCGIRRNFDTDEDR